MAKRHHRQFRTPPVTATTTHTHNNFAHKIARERQVHTHPITTSQGPSHLVVRNSPSLFTKNSVSSPSTPPTETHRGVKVAWQACEYLRFLLLLPATVTHNQVPSYRGNLLQQIIKTEKCHCCAFMALDQSIREVNY